MENASESKETNKIITYYCHVCKSPQQSMTDSFKCPTCNSGFIEKKITPENQNNIVPPSILSGEIQTPQQFLSNAFGSLSSPGNVTESSMHGRGEIATLQNVMHGRDIAMQMDTRGRDIALQMHVRERDERQRQMVERGGTLHSMLRVRQFNHNNMVIGRRHSGTHRGLIRVRDNDFLLNNPARENPAVRPINPPEPSLIMDEVMLEHRGIIADMMLSFSMEDGLPPFTNVQVDRIPTLRISQDHLDVNLQCHICLEVFSLDEEVLKLVCNHMYHKQCITPWITRHATCPVCRQLLSIHNLRRNPARNRLRRSNSLTPNLSRRLATPHSRNLSTANIQESRSPVESANVNNADTPDNQNYDFYDRLFSARDAFAQHPQQYYYLLPNSIDPNAPRANILAAANFIRHIGETVNFNNMESGGHLHPDVSPANTDNMESGGHLQPDDSPANTDNMESGGHLQPDDSPANTDNMESGGHLHPDDSPANTDNMESGGHLQAVDRPANTDNMDINHHGID